MNSLFCMSVFISCNIPCYNSAFLHPDLVYTVKALTYLASLTFPDTFPQKNTGCRREGGEYSA